VTARLLGIAVSGPDVQSEGVDSLLANLIGRAGVTAVTCSTRLATPAAEGEGSLEPPSDAGASVRLLDRPLWGKRSLYLTSAPGHVPHTEFFPAGGYQPPAPTELTAESGHILADFFTAANDAGLTTFTQVNAAGPPQLRPDDTPLLPDGSVPQRLAGTGSLASPAIRAWNRAWLRDTYAAYPDLGGIRVDYPEYACYMLPEAFQGFDAHLDPWAREHGFDPDLMRADAGRLYAHLHGGLTNAELEDVASAGRGGYTLAKLLLRFPGVAEALRCRAALSADMLADWRSALTEIAGADRQLHANFFATPFNLITGFDVANAAEHCGAVGPKLYTMHWPMVVEFWARELLDANDGLDERRLVRALVHLFDLGDADAPDDLAAYHYPEPDEPHPIADPPQRRKIAQTVADAAGRTGVHPLVHGYGPLDDFRRRLQVVADSAADGVWVNRYSYLSDDKLDAIGDIWGRAAR